MEETEILYVHGYNSSGRTGNALEQILAPLGYRLHHMPIPQRADQAIPFVRQYLKEHPAIRLVVGSSLGAFVALQQTGYQKLVVNPCLHPSVELPKIGASENIAQSYLPYELKLPDINTPEEHINTFALFSDNDELLNYRPEFETNHNKEQVATIIGGKHRLTTEELHTAVVPAILEILNRKEPSIAALFRHNTL